MNWEKGDTYFSAKDLPINWFGEPDRGVKDVAIKCIATAITDLAKEPTECETLTHSMKWRNRVVEFRKGSALRYFKLPMYPFQAHCDLLGLEASCIRKEVVHAYESGKIDEMASRVKQMLSFD